MLDVHANGILYDLKQKLARFGNIPVYGPANQDRFFKAGEDGTLPSPSVLLCYISFPGTETCFTALTPQNQWAYRPFNANIFPLNCAFMLTVAASDPQSLQGLSNVIRSSYSNGYPLLFQNPYFPQERVPIFLKAEAMPEQPEHAGRYFTQNIGITDDRPQVPCFFDSRELANARDTNRLALECLGVAFGCEKILAGDPMSALRTRYAYVTAPTPPKSGRFKNAFGGLKKMRKAYQNGAQLDQNEFASAFPDIIAVLPDLYGRAMNREPVETTAAVLQNALNQYWMKKNQICDALGIPQQYDLNIPDDAQPRSLQGMRSMITTMASDVSCTVFDAMQAYEMEAQSIHEQNEAQQAQLDAITARVEAAIDDRMDSKIGELSGMLPGSSVLSDVYEDKLRSIFKR